MSVVAAGSSSAKSAPQPPVLCTTAKALYAPPARDAIGEHLEGFLARNLATPFELLYRPDLAAKLENSGGELQQALQKVAVPAALAGAGGGSVHEVIRGLHRVFDQAVGRLMGLKRQAPIEPMTPARLSALDPELAQGADTVFRMGAEIAAAMAEAADYAGKLELLLDLFEAAPTHPGGVMALGLIEQPLREALRLPAARAELYGADLELGELLTAQLALAEAPIFAAVARVHPALAGAAKPLHPTLARLAAALGRGAFPAVRRMLDRQILAAFAGRGRLRPRDAKGEIELLRLLAATLTASVNANLPEEEVRDAVVARSKLLVEPDFLGAILGPTPEPLIELAVLVQVLENVAGDANRRRAVRLLEAAVASRRLQQAISEARDPLPLRETVTRLRLRVVRAAPGVAGVEGLQEELGRLEVA